MNKLPNKVYGSISCTEAQRKCAEMLYSVYGGELGRFHVTSWELNVFDYAVGWIGETKYSIAPDGAWKSE